MKVVFDTLSHVMNTPDLPATLRDALARLAESSDRTSPPVFAGRESEFALLDASARGVQRGEVGHTTVVQGVPGAGKTALLEEYAARLLLANSGEDEQVVPVVLRPRDIDDSPAAIVETIERGFRDIRESGEWARMVSRAADGAVLAANAVFSAFTKRDFNQFKPSARAPNSLSIALNDYAEFRIGRRNSTIVLLVDEAQNLGDTTRVRAHLDALHGGIRGYTRAMLACFGLANTVDRLRTLGLSRLASGHVRTIGALSGEDARRSVTGTLELAFANHIFGEDALDDAPRKRWIGAATRRDSVRERKLPAPLGQRLPNVGADPLGRRHRRRTARGQTSRPVPRIQARVLRGPGWNRGRDTPSRWPVPSATRATSGSPSRTSSPPCPPPTTTGGPLTK